MYFCHVGIVAVASRRPHFRVMQQPLQRSLNESVKRVLFSTYLLLRFSELNLIKGKRLSLRQFSWGSKATSVNELMIGRSNKHYNDVRKQSQTTWKAIIFYISLQQITKYVWYKVLLKKIQSELKGMVGELIYEVKYQISAGPGGP